MFRFSVIPIVLGTLLVGPAKAPAESPPADFSLADNAALGYWKAFAMLPKMDKDQDESLQKSLKNLGPVPKDLIPVIEASKNAMHQMHRAAAMPLCQWGVAREEGLNAMLPHLSKIRELTWVACLRAQFRFERGQAAGAIRDATAVMALGRHTSTDELLISILVDYAIERQAIRILAAYLPGLEPDALNELSRSLDGLPARRTVHDAILTEKEVFLGWLIRELRKEGGKEKLLQLFDDSKDPAAAALKALPRTELLKSAIESRAFYDKMARIALLPLEEVKKAEADLIADPGLEGPVAHFAKMLAPGVFAGRRAEAECQARLALLEAAVAVAGRGKEALRRKEHRDPFGQGPFEYTPFDGGFELASKLADRQGKPISITAGLRAAE